MSKLYFKNKKEFIQIITNNTDHKGKLLFEKIIPDYNLFLPFIPKVLINIIAEYISDMSIHSCKYKLKYIPNAVSLEIKPNILASDGIYYSKYYINFHVHEDRLIVLDYYDDFARYNTFMKKHYGKESYLPYCKYYSLFRYTHPRTIKYVCVVIRQIMMCIQKHEKRIISIINDFHKPY